MKRYIRATYDAWSVNSINKYIKLGIDYQEADKSFYALIDRVTDMTFSEIAVEFAECGYNYGTEFYPATVQTWYRIGEPLTDRYSGGYKHSYNYANDKPEIGVSVISKDWLHSVKSVFFGAHDDETLQTRGVWKIPGVQVGWGGDDEPLIYPTGYAEKLNINTFEELEALF